jgi:hypothetical protein
MIDVLKFIHLLITLSLLGSTFFCLILVSFPTHPEQTILIKRFNRIILWLLSFAIVTGTLLIYPKHFTFHTPWIKAAYVFVFLCGGLLSMLMVFRKKYSLRWFSLMSYLLLIILLIAIIHDAVTKTTFLF